MREKLSRIKDENKILIMLAFYSVAIGLWGNFRQLWLQGNNLDVSTISKILSLGTLMCAICLFITTKYTSLSKIKKFLVTVFVVKVITFILMYILNSTGNTSLIGLLSIIDIVTEKLITINVYPFILTIKKDDILYSKRKLVEYLFRDIGILIGGTLIGRTIFGLNIDYNILLLVSFIFTIISVIILLNIKQDYKEEKKESNLRIVFELFKDEIFKIYLMFILVSHIAMSTGLGLKILMLTNLLGFSASEATNYLLVVGLIADFIGILAVKHLTPKNDYVTVTIKFGIRFALYLITFFTNNLLIAIVAITCSILISTAYENIIDAPFINRIKNEHQLMFNSIRYIIQLIGQSIGLYYAGLTYNYGIHCILGMSAFFMVFQIGFAYRLVYMRKKEEKIKKAEN